MGQGWTLADVLDDAQFELLVAEAERALGRFVAADGAVAFSAPAGFPANARDP